jgi:hypothetical protein
MKTVNNRNMKAAAAAVSMAAKKEMAASKMKA